VGVNDRFLNVDFQNGDLTPRLHMLCWRIEEAFGWMFHPKSWKSHYFVWNEVRWLKSEIGQTLKFFVETIWAGLHLKINGLEMVISGFGNTFRCSNAVLQSWSTKNQAVKALQQRKASPPLPLAVARFLFRSKIIWRFGADDCMCCFNVYRNLFFIVHWFLSFLRDIIIFKLEGSSTSTTSTSSTSTSSTTTVPFRCRTLVEDNVEVEMQRWNGCNLWGVFFVAENRLRHTGGCGIHQKWV